MNSNCFRFPAVLLIIVLFSCNIALAQKAEARYPIKDSLKQKALAENNISFSMIAGSSFTTSFGKGNYMSTYLAPQLKYKFSPKFTLNAGIAVVNNYSGYKSSSSEGNKNIFFPQNITRTFAFAGGEYQLNKRFTLNAQAYGELPATGDKRYQNLVFDKKIKGMAVGMDYKVSEHSSVGVQFHISNDNNSFYNYPNVFQPTQTFFGQ